MAIIEIGSSVILARIVADTPQQEQERDGFSAGGQWREE
ncbi:hypothetical protein QE422_001698 [Chryseobacterium sp. SORGH_AS 447]|nr:hypothetical protein [Chryseobacterium sp. SORGH_AS_0447]